MKYIKCRWLLAMIMSCSLFSCTNLDEEVFDRVDAGISVSYTHLTLPTICSV